MIGTGLRHRFIAFALVAPLLFFLGLFFLWPLTTMMTQAIFDPVVMQALPRTAHASIGWDRQAPPTLLMQESLVEDLRHLQDDQVLGDVVRKLNGIQAGFRTLMAKTVARVRDDPGEVDLKSVDRRWGDIEYWKTISDAASTSYTDRNLLAAIDLGRNDSGSVAQLPVEISANRAILVRTFVMAASVTFFCVLIGLPYAMLAASVSGWMRQVLLSAVLLPLWTSLLVRTAAWFILLQDNGLINKLMIALHITDSPIPLIFNRAGVIIAMTHVLLPFMVLPIFSVLIGIPKHLMPAAASLGANPIRVFWRILLPLSLTGIISGSLLVFMVAIGYYITPALLGGPKDQMISSVIAFYAIGSANWGMAGALGIVLLCATILLYAVYNRLSAKNVAMA